MTDQDLLDRLANGDEDAAREFEHEYRPRLLRFLAGRGVLPPDAEDLIQVVFLIVFRQIQDGRFRGASGIFTWIISILRNKVSDYWKARGQFGVEVRMATASADGGEAKEVAAVPEGVIDAEGRAILRDILDRLPSQHRAILLLHETEGWTTDEIAERLKMHPGTVGRKLWEAKRKLREVGRCSPGNNDQTLLGSGGEVKKRGEGRD